MSAPPLALWEEQLALSELRRLFALPNHESWDRALGRLTGDQRRLVVGAAAGVVRERAALRSAGFDGRVYRALVEAGRLLRARGPGLQIELFRPSAEDGHHLATIVSEAGPLAEGRDRDPVRAIAGAISGLGRA